MQGVIIFNAVQRVVPMVAVPVIISRAQQQGVVQVPAADIVVGFGAKVIGPAVPKVIGQPVRELPKGGVGIAIFVVDAPVL